MFRKWTVVRFMYIIIIDDKSRHDGKEDMRESLEMSPSYNGNVIVKNWMNSAEERKLGGRAKYRVHSVKV